MGRELDVLGLDRAIDAEVADELIGIVGARHDALGIAKRLDHDGEVVVLQGRDGEIAQVEARAIVVVGRERLEGTRVAVGVANHDVDRASVEFNGGNHFEGSDGALGAGAVALHHDALHMEGSVDLVLFHLALDVILRSSGKGNVGEEKAEEGHGEERGANHDEVVCGFEPLYATSSLTVAISMKKVGFPARKARKYCPFGEQKKISRAGRG